MARWDNGQSLQEDVSPPFGEEILTRPIDQAMLPFYRMTNFFLREIIVRGSLKELNATVNLANPEAIKNSLKNDWQTWINHYLGYFLVFVFSTLLALAIVISSVSFCCCRRKGRCGSQNNTMESNRFIKYIRWIINGLFLILVFVLLLASIGTFITSRLTYEQTRESETTSDISRTLMDLNDYSLDIASNLKDIKQTAFDEGLTEFNSTMDDFPKAAQSDIMRETYIQEAIDTFNEFLNRVPILYNQLGYMDNLAVSLQEDLSYLDENITSTVADMEASFLDCSADDLDFCIEALEIAQSIQILKDYSTVSNVSEAQEGIISATQGNFTLNNTMQRTIEASNMIQYVITNTTLNITNDIYKEVGNMSVALDTFSNNTLKYITPENLTEAMSYVNETLSPNVATFDYYRYIAATILNSSILLIVGIFFFALFFGTCGTRAADHAPCLNRGKGGKMLIAGVITSFIVTWITVLASGFLLIVGGFINTEICSNLINPDHSDDIQVLDYILTTRLNSSIAVSSVMNNCNENQPFYSAFEIPQRAPDMNISSITNVSAYNFQELFSNIGDMQYNINLDLIDDDSLKLYKELETSFQTVDPETYFDVINEDLSNTDLFSFANFLNETSQKVSDSRTAASFVYFSELFRATAYTFVPRITIKEAVLYPIVDSAYDTLIFGFQEYVQTMVERAESVDSETLQAASAYHSLSAVPVLASAAENTSVQIQETGRCKTVYHSVRSGVTSVCVKWLYPFNTYWFCLGSAFFFMFVLLWPALYLDKLYRKISEFDPEMSSMTDTPIYPHSNIQDSHRGSRNFRRERLPHYSTNQSPSYLPAGILRTSTTAVINPVFIPEPDYDESDETIHSSDDQTHPKAVFSIGAFFKRKSVEHRISENSVDISQDFF